MRNGKDRYVQTQQVGTAPEPLSRPTAEHPRVRREHRHILRLCQQNIVTSFDLFSAVFRGSIFTM